MIEQQRNEKLKEFEAEKEKEAERQQVIIQLLKLLLPFFDVMKVLVPFLLFQL